MENWNCFPAQASIECSWVIRRCIAPPSLSVRSSRLTFLFFSFQVPIRPRRTAVGESFYFQVDGKNRAHLGPLIFRFLASAVSWFASERRFFRRFLRACVLRFPRIFADDFSGAVPFFGDCPFCSTVTVCGNSKKVYTYILLFGVFVAKSLVGRWCASSGHSLGIVRSKCVSTTHDQKTCGSLIMVIRKAATTWASQ